MSAVLTETDPNPLLRIWREVHQSDEYRWMERDFGRSIRNKPDGLDAYTRRTDVVRTYAFSVPTDEALDAIGEHGPVVEIGAGTGYWAALLRQRGVDVFAYDCALPGDPKNNWYAEAEAFTEVWHGDTSTAAKWPDRTLLLSWPPYGSDMASQALQAYEAAGGRTVAYIGEGQGGCCADEAFFDRLGAGYVAGDETDQAAYVAAAPWREVRSVLLPQWSGINDWLTIYERRPL